MDKESEPKIELVPMTIIVYHHIIMLKITFQPTIIFHGVADKTVPYSSAQLLQIK